MNQASYILCLTRREGVGYHSSFDILCSALQGDQAFGVLELKTRLFEIWLRLDLAIYIDIVNDVKFAWKVQRDVAERGWTEDQARSFLLKEPVGTDEKVDRSPLFGDLQTLIEAPLETIIGLLSAP